MPTQPFNFVQDRSADISDCSSFEPQFGGGGGLFKAIINPDYSAMDFKKRSMSNAAQRVAGFTYESPIPTPDKSKRSSNIFS